MNIFNDRRMASGAWPASGCGWRSVRLRSLTAFSTTSLPARTKRGKSVSPARFLIAAVAGLFLLVCSSNASAASLGTWPTVSVGNPAKVFVSGIAYGNGVWVAVGQGGFVSTSPDGKKWTRKTAGIARDFNDVIFSNGRFIAVCKAPNTGSGAKIWVSDDGGNTWKWRDTDSGLDFISVGLHAVASDGNGNLMAVGGNGWSTRSYDNGQTWHVMKAKVPASGPLITTQSLYAVCYGNGQWLAANNAGGLYRSTDGGDNWSTVSTAIAATDIACGNGKFVLADNKNNKIRWSMDGINWKDASHVDGGATNFSYPRGCVFNDGLFAVVTEYGEIFTSENGVKFNQWKAGGKDPDAWCIASGQGILVAGGGDFTLKYGIAWKCPDWLKARLGTNADYPFTIFDGDDTAPSRIGLPRHMVNTSSLNLVLKGTLFYAKTKGAPLQVKAVYNSQPNAAAGLLGKGWMLPYESLIYESEMEATVISGGGRPILFTANATISGASVGSPITLIPPDGNLDELKCYGSYYELKTKGSKQVMRFDKASGSQVGRLTAITDRNANKLTVSYSDLARGKIDAVTDDAGRKLQFSYGSNGLIGSVRVPDGRMIYFVQDSNLRLTSITDMAGYVARYTYDADGFLDTMLNDGALTRFAWTARPDMSNTWKDKLIASVTNPAGATFKYVSANGTTTVTDPKGGVTVLGSESGQTTKTVDPLGAIRSMQFSPTSNLPVAFTDPTGDTTTIKYDARGNVLATTDALGNTTSYTYDAKDNVIARTDALGNKWAYTYDARDNVLTATSPLAHKTALTYTASGQLETLKAPLGNTSSFTYNNFGNMLKSTDPGANSLSLAWDSSGLRCTSITDQAGNTKTLAYDANDRLVSRTYNLPGGAVTTSSTYQETGQTAYTDELGGVTRMDRDAEGYITSLTNQLGFTRRSIYDLNHNVIDAFDAMGSKTTTTYDKENRPLAITGPMGNKSAHAYDKDGHLISFTDQKGGVTKFTYDKNGSLVAAEDATGKKVSNAVDALGRVTTATNARGGTVSFAYDKDGRNAGITSGDGTVSTSFERDDNGNVTGKTDAWGKTSYTYGSRDEVTGINWPDATSATFTANALGLPATITYPNGQVFYYRYDRAGNLLEVDTEVVRPEALPGTISRKVGMDGALDVTGGNPMGAHVYSAQGLPSGLKIDPVTGQISGRIAALPGNYTISYWSQAGKHKSDVLNATMQITGFPTEMVGSFDVLLFDDQTDNPAGKVELAVTDKGVLSGKLLDDQGGSRSLSGTIQLISGNGTGSARVVFAAKTGQPAPSLDIAISSGGNVTCEMNSGVRQVASGTADLKLATAYTTKNPAPWQGTYTMALDPVDWTATSPAGTGYASAVVSPAGVLTLRGKLADGTALTGSGRPATDGSYSIFLQPHGQTASYLAGVVKMQAGGNGTYFADETTGSVVYWTKAERKTDRAYPAGFGPLEIEPIMQKWTTSKDLPATLGLPASGEFGATIWGGGLDSTGNVTVSTGCPVLPSDAFAVRPTIGAGGGIVVGSNLRATKEKDEPVHAYVAGGASVWWQWTPAISGSTIIETTGSDFDTVLAIYTGTALKTLTRGSYSDNVGTALTSGVTFNAVAGTTYYIAVDGKSSITNGKTSITKGNISLTVTPTAATGRLNNHGIPAVLSLSKANRITTAEKTPVLLSGSVNPATGVFTASFAIKGAAISNWQPKLLTRTVTVEGVLFGGSSGDLGAGLFLLPSTTTSGTTYSGQVILTRTPPRAKY